MTLPTARPTLDDLDKLATGRHVSCFAADLEANDCQVGHSLDGTRILIIGAAGTIGEAVAFHPALETAASVDLVDLSENGLVEVIRNIRARPARSRTEYSTFCFDFGSAVMRSFLEASRPFDVVFNLAAVKHVRAERDVYSTMHMVETNVIKQSDLLRWLAEFSPNSRYFSVSTDKAANPSSLMGATKRVMEAVIFEGDHGHLGAVTAARFANVAFSAGSLPEAWQFRLAKRQPLASPRGARRYFINRREAADLCVMAATLAPTGHVVVPANSLRLPAVDLAELARRFLIAHGWVAEEFDDESAAIAAFEPLVTEGRWPLVITPLDTSGEKELEEFVGSDDKLLELPFGTVDILRPGPLGEAKLIDFLNAFSQGSGSVSMTKEDISHMIAGLVPTLNHRDTGRSLDGRL